ncbi:MAG TPA: chemotaxis protein CheA, partial [Geobacteraceae bacterium]
MSAIQTTLGKAAKDFLAEAEEIIDQLSNDLVGLNECVDSGEYHPDTLNSIFRGAHSLKGLAGMFGFSQIQELAHALEDLLDSLRLGKTPFNQQAMAVLFDSLDFLGTLVRNAGEGTVAEAELAHVLARLNNAEAPQEAPGSAQLLAGVGLSPSILNAFTEYEEHRLQENIRRGRQLYSILASFDLTTFDKDLSDLTDSLKKVGEVISTLPSVGGGSLESTIDFEIIFGADKGLTDVAAAVDRSEVSVRQLGTTGVGVATAAPAATTLPAVPAQPAEQGAPPLPAAQAGEGGMTAKSMSRTVRVDIGKLDDLMNIVGELVLSHATIADLAIRLSRTGTTPLTLEMTKAAKVLERKLTELQKGVMEIRMIPVGQLYEKMGRIVRKISREQGKKVDLKLFGADTELDKLIIEDISDPLMHIIRNAVDHGIELPEERLRSGKSEKGTIRLASYQKGNHVVIEVEDDGKGIDLVRVRRKAQEKGLITHQETVSDREALDLLFLPGFSTADAVSEISGRGVGMDVVKSNIAAISGMVDIDSIVGAGSRVTITLPITLAIIKALLIATADRIYALPITSVLETIMLEQREILTVERKEVIQLRGQTLPLLRLDRFFALDGKQESPDSFYVVVVGAAEKRLGIVVDDLLGQQDIVIKSLGSVFEGVKGISGAADLGDQRTILVL